MNSSSSIFVDDFNHTRLNIEIRDNNKAAITNAIITITLTRNDSTIKSVILDKGNFYTVDNLNPDNYNIKIQSVGYMGYEITNVELSYNKGIYLNFELGQSDAFVQMGITSNKKLSPRQLQRRIVKTEKEINK